jgi:DNA gyrase subunit A
MARRKTTTTRVDPAAFDRAGARVFDNPVQIEIEDSYLEYAYSVIHSRALPDARDGLKPVHRRILFSMNENGYRPSHAYVKSSRVVGDVMGRYHPHGDTAIYDAMVRLAQDFSMNVSLVDGHGNFGSVDDGPAASRYTEARLSPEAMLLVGELGEDTVDFRPNYDRSLAEPSVLPAAFPNLLVNGASGIAVGMATTMIPHNLGEVIGAARWLIRHPDASLDRLMGFVLGPDLPTGGVLLGLDEVRRAYETGRGVVRMRAKVEIGPLEGGRGRQTITITELPYAVGPEKIIEKITDEVNKSKRLTGIADVKDLTDRENGTRLVIECKVGVNPRALLADLYRLTPMEQSFGINNLVLVDGQPRTLGLKALLEVFLKHRYAVVTRRTRYRRRRREERLHLVEGLLTALLDIDKVIKLIRGSEDAQAAKDGLMKRFTLSEIQATHILDTPLRRLTRYERLELEAEDGQLRKEIAGLSAILDDEAVLKKVVSDELAKIAKDFATERRTALIDGDLKEVLAASQPAGPLEVADDPCQVILSATGLVARTAAESEEVSEGRRRSGRVRHDAVSALVHTTAHGQVLLITNRGRAFKTDVLPLPVLPERAGTVSLRGGMAARELAPLDAGERVIGLAPLAERAAGSPGLALGTRQGCGEDLRAGLAGPRGRVRRDQPQGRGRGRRGSVVDRRHRDPGVRVVGRLAAAVPGLAGPAAGTQGRRHGRHEPARRSERGVLRRGPHRRPRARRADGRHGHRARREGDPVRRVSGQGPGDRRCSRAPVPQGRDRPRRGLGGATAGGCHRQGRSRRVARSRPAPRRTRHSTPTPGRRRASRRAQLTAQLARSGIGSPADGRGDRSVRD